MKPRLYLGMNQYLDESLTGKSMIAYAYLFDWSGGNTDHSQLSKGRWRCFKSTYGEDKILEVSMDRKLLEKGRKSKKHPDDKVIGEIKIGKVA